MKNEYLSIKEFAKMAGKSQQAIYKQVERKLNKYVKLVDNQKKINISALQEVYGIEVEQPIQPRVEEVEQPIQQLVNMLQEQLKVKDEQIKSLQSALDNTTNALKASQENLKAAQLLQANAEQKLLQIEEPNQPTTPKDEKIESSPYQKKGFWFKLFKR